MDEVTRSTTPLSTHQKAGFVLLLVFGLLAVGLGALQMRNTIYSPFAYKSPTTIARTTEDLLQDETIRLQSIDTDQDGLSDYEELYFYQTSPYIPDTDSDGISDKAELDASSDPTCPQGAVCDGSDQFFTSQASSTATTPMGIPSGLGADGILRQVDTSIAQGQEVDLGALLGNVDAVREIIAQTGKIPKEQLDQIDDQTLLNLVIEIMAEEETSPAVPLPTEEASASTTFDTTLP